MANSLLVNLTTDDDKPMRLAVTQQWYEAVSVAFRSKYRGVPPASGNNYLIDSTTNDIPQTVACADVAWISSASS